MSNKAAPPVGRDEPVYLGDGLYVMLQGHQIELWASNGIHKTNSVFFDRSTIENFTRYLDMIRNHW
jgi:hypothetical protein